VISKLHYESQLSDGKGGNKDSLNVHSVQSRPSGTSERKDPISERLRRVALNILSKVPGSSASRTFNPCSVIPPR
jgi:hypothetical protein